MAGYQIPIRQQEITAQFYAWEILGRGWLYAPETIELEPPYTPFFGHYISPSTIRDDGMQHTLLSSVATLFKKKQPPVLTDTLPEISYSPYSFTEDTHLISYTAIFPRQYKISSTETLQFLTMLSYITRPVSFEIRADHQQILVLYTCRDEDAGYLEAQLHTCFPEFGWKKKIADYDDLIAPRSVIAVVDYGLKEEFMRPLNQYKQQEPDSLVGLLSLCEYLQQGEKIIFQVLCNGLVNHWSNSMLSSVSTREGEAFFEDAPEMLPMTREKIQHPLMACTIRAMAYAGSHPEAFALINKVSFALTNQSRSAGNSLMPLIDEAYTVTQRINDIALRQSHRCGMLLNILELAQFVHLPSLSPAIRKLYLKERKTKPAPVITQGHDTVLGINTHQGTEFPVTISTEQRLKHTHIIGATGTGKSTLIANLVLQDIQQGSGIALFDPHGDLIDEVISRIPPERIKDVVLIDPADSDYPVGINLLEAHSELEKEILSSDLVASFRKLSTSWGDQMNAVFGNAILAFLESKEGGTLHDLRRFLVERDFRNKILATITDPSVQYYWQKEYPLLKTNSIGPILTRLDTFLRPRVLRNMVIQKSGVNFSEVLQSQKILLVKLSQGLIGTENSYLLGSLILSKIHQAAFARQQNKTNRHPFYVYIDEFQHFVTPSVKDMLSGVRKYSVGLILSHQDLQQVQKEDAELLHSMLSNTSTRIVFRVGEQDAKRLSEGFVSFDNADFQNLGKGEAVMRIEQPQYDCSLETIQLKDITVDEKASMMEQVIAHSRSAYATERHDVEQLLKETLLFEPEEEQVSIPKQKEEIKKPEPSPPVIPAQPITKPQPQVKEAKEEKEQLSTHRYLQTLIKKMAESKGYTATLELSLPDGSGNVDVLLAKDSKRVAVEICVTTDAAWEMHNIAKCIEAGYETIVSVSGDLKQLEKIRKQCETKISDYTNHQILFLTPDALFELLEEQQAPIQPEQQIIKGYRVNVSYDSISQEEMLQKRRSIAKVITDALKKRKNG